MAEAPNQPFTGFHIANPTRKFNLRLHKLEIGRRWSRSSRSGDKPEFVTYTRAEAIAEHDKVCVFGTNLHSNLFHLTINSDVGVAESWESIKGIDLLVDHDASDPERRRIRDLQYAVFDKTPPTATLFYHQGYWSLECEVPQTVLEQLCQDLITCGVARVRLEIEWPFGLTDDQSGWWGFFDGGQLRGHVATLAWSSATDEPSDKQEAIDPVREEKSENWARRIRGRIRGGKGY